MPELPEVESVCRILRRALVGKKIAEVEVVPDTIVFGKTPAKKIEEALEGKRVVKVGRKGKTWWIEMETPPILFGHLGMTGWVRELGQHTVRLREHGQAPLDDEEGRPRFLKLLITAEDGTRVSLTDGRRLARVWLNDSVEKDTKIHQLGFDARDELPRDKDFAALFNKRKAPIKALLMNQSILCGIGNWIADEVLYHARIAPARLANTLTDAEFKRLRKAIEAVLDIAVETGADKDKFPPDWLFHHRWGGKRGADTIGKHKIVREEVGGRTTAWVPAIQK